MEKNLKIEKTPLKLFKKKHLIEGKASQQIPASPLMKKLGYGTGIAVYLLPRSKNNFSSTSTVRFNYFIEVNVF